MGNTLSDLSDRAGVRGVEGLLLGRIFLRFGFVLVSLSMDSHLIDTIANKDTTKGSRLKSMMSTVNSLVAFALKPITGALVDSVGRKPFLVLCPILAAIARMSVVVRGRPLNYVLYRLMINIAFLPLWPAISGYVADRFEPGTLRQSRAMQRMSLVLTLTGLLALRVGGRIGSARANIALSCLLNLAAAFCFLSFAPETLKKEDRKPLKIKTAANPLSFIRVLSKSKRLMALAPLYIMQNVPDYDSTTRAYYKKRFNWGVSEIANLMFWNRISGIFESVCCLDRPLIQLLGLKKTAQLSCIVGAAQCANTAFTLRPNSVLLNSALDPLRHGRSVVMSLIQTEAKRQGIGQGELQAALGNLLFPLRLVAPSLFTELYTNAQHTLPMVNFIARGSIQLAISSIVIPNVWAKLGHLPEMVEDRYAEEDRMRGRRKSS